MAQGTGTVWTDILKRELRDAKGHVVSLKAAADPLCKHAIEALRMLDDPSVTRLLDVDEKRQRESLREAIRGYLRTE